MLCSDILLRGTQWKTPVFRASKTWGLLSATETEAKAGARRFSSPSVRVGMWLGDTQGRQEGELNKGEIIGMSGKQVQRRDKIVWFLVGSIIQRQVALGSTWGWRQGTQGGGERREQVLGRLAQCQLGETPKGPSIRTTKQSK